MATTGAAEVRTRVLVVDDDHDMRRRTVETLSRHGYSCVGAETGAEARMVLETDPSIAAVLCDITMPGTFGVAHLGELVADFPDLAVVMMTAGDDPRVADMVFDLGAFGYLTKPFAVNELLINLASAVRRRVLEMGERDHARALEETIARTRMLGRVFDGIEGRQRGSFESHEMIEMLSRALSLGGEETGHHIERMSRYAVVLATAVEFAGASPEDLRLATALHDVGKIGVPDAILLKPGSLSLTEYAAMQRHTQIGHQLLSDSRSDILQMAADIALSHHEWWDGSGYPRGLTGGEIREGARIAAIADVFDALTSDRVYRAARPVDEALAIMSSLRGRQFEPRLLDAFVGSMKEIAAVRATYPDVDEVQESIRILVVDDHEIFAHSLVRLLGSKPELKVVGTAHTAAAAVTAAVKYRPDVILMDFELPDADGPTATERIRALVPTVHVIMLTARTDDEALVRAIAAGCSGFVKKEDAVDTLFEAIVAAHRGDTIASAGGLVPLLRVLRPTRRGVGSDLTHRELEILALMASGLGNKQISQRLGVRLNTVRNHAQSILYKLQAHSRLEAVATAVRERIIRYPDELAAAE